MKILLITGPSGAGKDSLLRIASLHFKEDQRFTFVRRYITRQPDANEQNFFVDSAAFSLLSINNFFISRWQAHGNLYGIPRNELPEPHENKLAVISISRGNTGDFENVFDQVITLGVEVDPDILHRRLQARGREDEKGIEERLCRQNSALTAGKLLRFDNSEDLSVSGRKFVSLLESLTIK